VLTYQALFELALQVSQCTLMFGDHDETRCVSIETMDNPRAKLSAYTAQIWAMGKDRINQSALRMPNPRMYDNPRRLVDHDQIPVFVDNVQRDSLSD